MKKLLSLLLILSMLLSTVLLLTSCATDKDGDSLKKVESEKNKAPDVISIEEQVVYNHDGIVVTALGLTKDILFGDAIKLLIENNGDKVVNVNVDSLYINGFEIYPFFVEEVAVGKKANSSLYISDDTLEKFGINTVGKIEMVISVDNPETYETYHTSDLIAINTNAYDVMDTEINAEGEEIYNANGIRIESLGIEDSILGSSIYIYVENTCDKNIMISADSFSVNGFMIDPWFVTSVESGRKGIDTVLISSQDIEDNGIEKIENVEFVLEISDNDTWDTIAQSDVITLALQ